MIPVSDLFQFIRWGFYKVQRHNSNACSISIAERSLNALVLAVQNKADSSDNKGNTTQRQQSTLKHVMLLSRRLWGSWTVSGQNL